jgi:hypothetical protein
MWKTLQKLFTTPIDHTEKKIDVLRKDMKNEVKKTLKDQRKVQKIAVQYDGRITKDILRSQGFNV